VVVGRYEADELESFVAAGSGDGGVADVVGLVIASLRRWRD
jgi:hypothetical protein